MSGWHGRHSAQPTEDQLCSNCSVEMVMLDECATFAFYLHKLLQLQPGSWFWLSACKVANEAHYRMISMLILISFTMNVFVVIDSAGPLPDPVMQALEQISLQWTCV